MLYPLQTPWIWPNYPLWKTTCAFSSGFSSQAIDFSSPLHLLQGWIILNLGVHIGTFILNPFTLIGRSSLDARLHLGATYYDIRHSYSIGKRLSRDETAGRYNQVSFVIFSVETRWSIPVSIWVRLSDSVQVHAIHIIVQYSTLTMWILLFISFILFLAWNCYHTSFVFSFLNRRYASTLVCCGTIIWVQYDSDIRRQHGGGVYFSRLHLSKYSAPLGTIVRSFVLIKIELQLKQGGVVYVLFIILSH